SGAYIGGAGTAGDLDTPAAQDYATNIIGKWFTKFPPGGDAAAQAASTFTYGYYVNTWGLIKGLEEGKGDISDQSKPQEALGKVELPAPYGNIKPDDNRQAVFTVYDQQLYMKDGKLAVKTVTSIPDVDQTFGGTFSSSSPPPGRRVPGGEKSARRGVGKGTRVTVVGGG